MEPALIYVIGNLHGEEDGFSEESSLASPGGRSKDVVIVTGDSSYVMRDERKYRPERSKLDALARKPYTILFCAGNHGALIIWKLIRKSDCKQHGYTFLSVRFIHVLFCQAHSAT